jgi:hypothetical protein
MENGRVRQSQGATVRQKRQQPKVLTFRDKYRHFVRDGLQKVGVASKKRKFGNRGDSRKGHGEALEDLQKLWE